MLRRFLVALALFASAPAGALILDSGDGQGNTSAPADDPGWDYVGRVVGPTGVYLGNGWVLTAAHVGAGDFTLGYTTYPVVPGSTVQLVNPDLSLADLHVFRIDPSPNLPLLKIRSTTPSNNTNLTMIAQGLSRGAVSTWGPGGYLWGTTTGMRWGTNRVAGTSFIGTWTFTTSFSASGTTYEAQGADGDSGGAVFIKSGGTWKLAGVFLAVDAFVGQPPSTAIYGNLTYSGDLSIYRSQLIAITRPECANEVDDDGDTFIDWPADTNCASELGQTELPDQDLDGVGDPEDNCLTVENAAQVDTNLDGYGNLCDADIDNNGGVGLTDFGLFKQAFLTSSGGPGYSADIDLDSDGSIGLVDYGLFIFMFGSPVGPSGLACAGTPPCQ